MTIITRLYEAITGRPWLTIGGHATADYGPPPGARYQHQLAAWTDAELYAHGETILNAVRDLEDLQAWLRCGWEVRRDTYWTPLRCGCPIGIVADEGHEEGCHRRHTTGVARRVVLAS
jgi:hypothetical protein